MEDLLGGDLNNNKTNRKGLIKDNQKRMNVALKAEHHDGTTSIGKFLSALNKLIPIGDVAVSFDPIHAALPWTAFRAVIMVSVPLISVLYSYNMKLASPNYLNKKA